MRGIVIELSTESGLELQFHDLYCYISILVDTCQGDTLRRFRAKGLD